MLNFTFFMCRCMMYVLYMYPSPFYSFSLRFNVSFIFIYFYFLRFRNFKFAKDQGFYYGFIFFFSYLGCVLFLFFYKYFMIVVGVKKIIVCIVESIRGSRTTKKKRKEKWFCTHGLRQHYRVSKLKSKIRCWLQKMRPSVPLAAPSSPNNFTS